MATNPNTKKLYQELRGALLSRNKQKTCITLLSILNQDPADTYAQGELSRLTAELNGKYEPILEKAAAEKDLATLNAAIKELQAYGDTDALAHHMPALEKALSMTTTPTRSAAKPRSAASSRNQAKSDKPAKAGDNPKTRELYKSLRSYIVAKNHDAAFKTLQEIISIDPQDADAAQQKIETGKWLCKTNAPRIEEALQSRDENHITQTVLQFREWANEAHLKANVPSYEKAAVIANAVRRTMLQQEFRVRFNRLSENNDPQHLNDEAVELERFAADYEVEISAEQKQCLTRLQEQWRAIQIAGARQALLDEANTEFSNMREDYARRTRSAESMLSYVAELETLHEKYSSEEQFPELTDFCLSIREEQTRAEQLANKIKQKKAFMIKLGAATSTLALIIGIFFVYVFATIDTSIKELQTLRANKQTDGVKVILEKTFFTIEGLQRALNTEYQNLCTDCSAWLNHYELRKNEYQNLLKEVDAACADSGTEKLLKNIAVYAACEEMIRQLNAEYGYKPGSEEIDTLVRFEDTLLARKDAIMSSLFSSSKDMPIKEMVQRNKLFDSVKQKLNITLVEQERFKSSIDDAVAHQLFYLERVPWHINLDEIEQGIKLYERYAGELQLPPYILNILNALKAEYDAYLRRDDALLSCTNLREFKATLEGFKTFHLMQRDRAVPPDKLKNTDEQLKQFAIEKALMNSPEIKKVLENTTATHYPDIIKKTADIFNSTSQDVFDNCFNMNIRKIIDEIVPANQSESLLWPSAVNTLEKDNKVYAYRRRKITHTEFQIRILDKNGNELEKIVSFPTDEIKNLGRKALHLNMIRSNLGFIRNNLMQKKISPVRLMQNIVESRRSNYPPLAKAYLYGQCIAMLNEYKHSLASGLALSPTLRSDMEEFKRINQTYPTYSGCWLEKHSKQNEIAWERFFTNIDEHNYIVEINNMLNPFLSVELEIVGYVKEDGKPRVRNNEPKLYYLSFDGGKEQLLPLQNGLSYPAYTPIFKLSSYR